jgi:hypothetical protein
MPTIRISEENYQNIIDLAASLQKSRKHQVTPDEVVSHLFGNHIQTPEEV